MEAVRKSSLWYTHWQQRQLKWTPLKYSHLWKKMLMYNTWSYYRWTQLSRDMLGASAVYLGSNTVLRNSCYANPSQNYIYTFMTRAYFESYVTFKSLNALLFPLRQNSRPWTMHHPDFFCKVRCGIHKVTLMGFQIRSRRAFWRHVSAITEQTVLFASL